MATLFISDLHLEPTRPAVTALFLAFLAGPARQAEALYILGDLFETWIGDDDPTEPGPQVAAALRRLSDAGVPVFFLHGNRDFLLSTGFAAASGLRLLPESVVIHLDGLGGEPVLLLHGDTLCTADTDYQAFRAQVRDPAWQARILALPLVERRQLAAQLRHGSRQALQTKAEVITDVDPDAVAAALRAHGLSHMIHGHTHRPAIHDGLLDGRPTRRAVLGDWNTQGSVLVCDASGWRLESLASSGH